MASVERMAYGTSGRDFGQGREQGRERPTANSAGKLLTPYCAAIDLVLLLGPATLAQERFTQSVLPPVPDGETIGAFPVGEDDGYEIEATRKMFPDGLSLADVIASLCKCYPEIQAARQEYRRADGELLSSWGTFDTKLQSYSLNEPTGYYENSRHAIGVARQTWWGGYLSAGYRIGRGEFQPWYKERETDKSGEFKIGWIQPLLRGKATDLNRVSVFRASLARQAAQPALLQAILDSAREATDTYWKWVAAGQSLRAQRELLQLAKTRGEQFEAGLKAGKFAEIDIILNRQLIAERQVKVLDSQRKFQAMAYKLSLYLRDEACQPIIPSEAWLPQRFPVTERPTNGNLREDVAASLARRPEPRILQIEINRMRWEQQLARNDALPQFDFVAEASQDVGPPASSSDDKDEFLVVVGVRGEVPIQRRKARGKLQSTSAKVAQLRQKLLLQKNKIETELRIAYNALQLNSQIVEQAELSLAAALDSLQRYRFAFDRGKVDLIYLNLLETKANETEIKLIEAQGNWFQSLGQMQSALGLDPLEQSLLISELPLSPRPGVGIAPSQNTIDEENFDRDWEIHSQAE
ncbi:MAG: TolC family protein [Planctomycetales bacterium]|nr:TolC family protein [Planctomycetales bacterium]